MNVLWEKLWPLLKDIPSPQEKYHTLVSWLSKEDQWDRVCLYAFTLIPEKALLVAASDAPMEFQLYVPLSRYPELAILRDTGSFFGLERISQAHFREDVQETLLTVGLKTLYAFPLYNSSQVVGALVFKGYSQSRKLTTGEMNRYQEIANFLSWSLSSFPYVLSPTSASLARDVYRNFFLFMEKAFITFVIINFKGVILYAQGSFLDILGYNPKDVIGKSIFHFLHHEDGVFAQGILHRFTHEHLEFHEHTYQVLSAKGKFYPIQAFTMRDPLKGDQLLIGLNYSLSGEVLFHQEIYRKMIWDDPEMAFILDPLDRYIAVNQRLCEVTGYAEEEFYALDFPGLSVPEERNLSRKRLARLLAGERLKPRIAHVQTKSGSILPVEVKTYPIRRSDGEVVAIMGVLREIDSQETSRSSIEDSALRKRLEMLEKAYQQLEQEHQYRQKFIQSTAHFLKTPLATLRAVMDTLTEYFDNKRDGTFHNLLEPAEESLTFMEDVINHLLELVMLRDGQVQKNPSLLRVKVLFEEAWARVYHRFRDKKLQLHLHIPEDFSMMTDENMFRQVIQHILENMGEKAPPHSSITIKYDRKNQWDVFTLTDEGPGIPENKLPFLFVPFLNPYSSTRKLHHGLGLPLAKALVDTLGGELQVYNNKDKGCTFEIQFPAHEK